MALTRARTAPGKPGGTGTGMGALEGTGIGALEGSSTANMHQDCLAEGCDGGEPPWHNTHCPDLYLPRAWAVPRAPEHLQQELGTSRVLHRRVRASRQGNHRVHQQTPGHTELGSHSTDFFPGVSWDVDTRLSSNFIPPRVLLG